MLVCHAEPQLLEAAQRSRWSVHPVAAADFCRRHEVRPPRRRTSCWRRTWATRRGLSCARHGSTPAAGACPCRGPSTRCWASSSQCCTAILLALLPASTAASSAAPVAAGTCTLEAWPTHGATPLRCAVHQTGKNTHNGSSLKLTMGGNIAPDMLAKTKTCSYFCQDPYWVYNPGVFKAIKEQVQALTIGTIGIEE